MQYDFDELNLKRKRDGKLRIVMFDIPNRHKVARDMFRSKLVGLGFAKIQESVFVTPYICKNEIEFIVNYLGISDHVILLQMGQVELGPDLKFKSVYNS